MATATGKSTRQLLGELFTGLKNLTREHVQEIKAERKEERAVLRRAPAQFGTAIGVTLLGALLGAQAIAFGLAEVGLPLWASFTIVAVIAIVIGVVLLRRLPDTSEMDTVPETAIKRIGQDIKEIAAEVAHDVRTTKGTHHQLPGDVRR